MKTVNVRAAKTHLSRLIEEAAASLKGKVRVSEDFDAPLPGDLLRAFGAKP